MEVSPFVTKKNKYIYFVVFGLLWIGLYLFTNHNQIFPIHHLPLSAVDRMLPFMPWTVWFYTSDYIFPLVALVLLKDSRNLTVTVISFIFMMIIATLFFVFFPTAYPRPDVSLMDVGWMLNWVYSTDAPINCFPSTHVALVFVMLLGLRRENKKAFWVFSVWAILISISTMTTRQHYFLDVLGGICLAYGSTLMANKLVREEKLEMKQVIS